MIELPEATVLADQVNTMVSGKQVMKVVPAHTPHKFAWYYGNPQDYHDLLADEVIGSAKGVGSMVEISAGKATLLFGDGVGLRYHSQQESQPDRHQLLIEFTDCSAISATVQMYGGLWCFSGETLDNLYYKAAKEKPSPLADEFDATYFDQLLALPAVQKLSAKAFLATEQRIPGLGNGVLQDILWKARIHPKRKVNTLLDHHKEDLFTAIKISLADMTALGGRDTEKDLFGMQGKYKTRMSKNTVNSACPVCNELIKKENYLGGSIYFCPQCQMV